MRKAVLPAAAVLCSQALLFSACRQPSSRVAPPAQAQEFSAASGAELENLRGIIKRAVERYGRVKDYRCIFHKRHRIGGSLQEEQRMLLKFMEPAQVYMKWLAGPHEGQEILYAPARYGKKGFARAGGFKGRLMPVIRIDVDGYWVRRDSIHDLDHVGIGYFLKIFMENSRRARKAHEGMLIDRGSDIVFGRPARVVEAVLPREKEKGYYCRRCVIFFDEENGLPIKVLIYGWDDELSEEYGYENLELDVGLTEKDFDRENPEYNF